MKGDLYSIYHYQLKSVRSSQMTMFCRMATASGGADGKRAGNGKGRALKARKTIKKKAGGNKKDKKEKKEKVRLDEE